MSDKQIVKKNLLLIRNIFLIIILLPMESYSRSKDLTIIIKKILFISLIILINKFGKVLSNDHQSLQSNIVIKKCCSPGSVLTLKDEIYSCKLTVKNSIEFFDRLTGNHWGFPNCSRSNSGSNLSFIPFDELNRKNFFNVHGDYCADILFNFNNNQEANYTAVIFCNYSKNDLSTQPTNTPTVMNVRRCCPKGEIFNIKNRACLPPDYNQEDITTASLVKNIGFSQFIYAIRGPPKCQHAIVDYEVNSTDVSIVDGRFQVTASTSHDVVDLLTTEESICFDVGSSPGLMVVRACRGVDYCRDNTCLRKCCMEDEALVDKTCQKLPSHMTLSKWHSEVWDLPKTMGNTSNEIMNTTEYGLLVGNPCLYQMYPVTRDEGWHIVTEGMVHVPGYKTYEHHQYCTDIFYNHSRMPDGFYPFICFEDPPPELEKIRARFTVNASLLSISCAFLLMTLFVYICLPTLQNLHGKTLMCHVASLFVAFGCLAMVAVATPKEHKIDSETEDDGDTSANLCKFLGFLMLFSFLSAFFWLNVMCFDIWWKFGSLRHSGKTNTKIRDDFKRFLSYCIYAWGLAFGFVIVAIIADYVEFLPNNLRPDIGVDRCWFSTDQEVYGEIIFFTGPVSLQLLVNMVFFILTARRCSMVKAEINRRVIVNRSDPRNRRFEADKAKLILNVKLFVVMGISWVLEVISYFLSNYTTNLEWKTQFFYVSDGVNCLQGLLIFVLFVLKKKVLYALKKRFSKRNNRRASTGGILDPYRVRKSPSSSTILSTFAVSSSP